MVKISIYADKRRVDDPVRVREMLPHLALDELVTNLSVSGFVEEDVLIPASTDSKADTLRIAVTTHLLGPIPTPYLVVFEGLLEEDMSGLEVVVMWFVKATGSASGEVLHKAFS